MYEWIKRHRSRQAGGIAVQKPTGMIGSRVFSVTFSGLTYLELLRQEDDGTIGIHVDLVISSPFVLRSADGTTYNLNPQTSISRTALAPVIDLFEGTITGVTVDGDDAVERDIAGNPTNALGTLTVDFADGAQLTVPAVADPYQQPWDLSYSDYLTLLFLSTVPGRSFGEGALSSNHRPARAAERTQRHDRRCQLDRGRARDAGPR